MKKLVLLTLLAFATVFIVAIAPAEKTSTSVIIEDTIELPDHIKEIVEAKCMGCHKPDSRNDKAKKKLQWVKVPDLDAEGQRHFIAEMFEVLEDGKMPPKKMLERKPEMKLTEDEVSAFVTWLEEEEKKLK